MQAAKLIFVILSKLPGFLQRKLSSVFQDAQSQECIARRLYQYFGCYLMPWRQTLALTMRIRDRFLNRNFALISALLIRKRLISLWHFFMCSYLDIYQALRSLHYHYIADFEQKQALSKQLFRSDASQVQSLALARLRHGRHDSRRHHLWLWHI